MKGKRYRISVTALEGDTGVPVPDGELQFTAQCHDDILAIVERVRGRGDLPSDEAAAMAVGLKLLGEVALQHRHDPLFAELGPQLGAFIQKLKQGRRPEPEK